MSTVTNPDIPFLEELDEVDWDVHDTGGAVSISLADKVELRDTATPDAANDIQWEPFGVIPGMSQSDFMARQRYLGGAGPRQYSFVKPSHASLSQPTKPGSSTSIHHFIQEQRKILRKFKAQPWPLQMKMTASRYHKANIWRNRPDMNKFDTLRDSVTNHLRKAKRKLEYYINMFTIGNSQVKSIEGRFGSGVASFFTFLRWICALNLVLALTVIGFLVLPQVILGHGLKVPNSVLQTVSPVSFIFDGKGYAFEYSVLFYGYYDSGRNEPYIPPPVNPAPYIGLGYKLPLGYILVILALFIVSIGAVLTNMAEKYRLLQRATVSEQYPFSWKVFAGWDFAITHPETANLKSIHTANLLRETINEADKLESKKDWKKWIVRFFTNLTVVLALGFSSYAIVLSVEFAESSQAKQQVTITNILSDGFAGLWQLIIAFQVQIVIVARNFILPYLFILMEYIERHHPRTALKVMLIRMFILYTTSLYVMVIALLILTQHCGSDGTVFNSNSSGSATLWDRLQDQAHLSESQSTNGTSSGQVAPGQVCCWETVVGQEMYKLSWTHLGAELGSLFTVEGLRWLVTRVGPLKKFGIGEFNLATNILRLVYGQALVWLGMLFCPLLPSIMFVKSIILFYVRVFVVRYFNRPPKSLFKVASTRNFYMALLLLMVFLCLFPVGYAAINIIPSIYCGPFRGQSSMVDVVNNEISSWPHVIQESFAYLKTATVLVPLFGLLCVIIYYYGALANALKEINKDLMLQLHVERKEARIRVAEESVAKRKGDLRDLVEERLEKRMKRASGLQADHSKALVPPNHQVVVNNIPVDTGEPHVLQTEQSHTLQDQTQQREIHQQVTVRRVIHHHFQEPIKLNDKYNM